MTAPQYASFGAPDLAPNAQNPTVIPSFDSVLVEDGNANFLSTAEFLAAYPRVPASGTVTLTGTVTAGETAYIELTNPALPGEALQVATLCISGDTLTTVAYRLVDLLNKNLVLRYFGVTAAFSVVSSNPVITIKWPGPIGNFTAVAGSSGASSATYTIGGTVVNGDIITVSLASDGLPSTSAVAQLAGTVTSGDVVTITFLNAALPNGETTASYTCGSDTLAQVATALATAINAETDLDLIGMTSNATNRSIYMTWTADYGAVGMSVTATRPATETITLLTQGASFPSALAPSPLPTELITIGGTVTTGDKLTLLINASGTGSQTGPIQINYTTQGGDTTATIAVALAALIEAASGLSGLFTTSVVGSAITVTWTNEAGNVGFDSAVLGVTTETGTVVNDPAAVKISYVAAGTATDIATALTAAINANKILIAGEFVATSAAAVITATYNGGLNPITLTGAAEGGETATVGGTVTAGDVLTLTVTNASLPGGAQTVSYTTIAGDTTTTIATALKNLLNANVNLATAGITAGSSAAVVTVTSISQYPTTYSRTLSTSATETLTLASLVLETITIANTVPVQTVTIGGTATAADTLNLKVASSILDGGSQTVDYAVVGGDTTTTMAAGLALAINNDENLAAAGITATSAAAVVSLVNLEPNPTPTLTAWSNGANKTLTLGGSTTTADVVNVLFTNALLSGGSYNLQYTVTSTDTTLTILAASIASAINANATLAAVDITATSAAAVVSIDWPASIGALTFAANANGLETITLGGTLTPGDIVTVTVTDASVTGSPLAVPYTVTGGDTTLTILAASIAATLQGTAALTSKGITTTSAAAVVSIRSVSTKATTYARTLSGGATVTATLAGNATETTTLAGGPTETLAVTDPTAGSEILTATTPLAGGAGPVIPLSNFTFSVADSNGGSTANLKNYAVGKPVLADYNEVDALIQAVMPVI